MIGKFVKGTSGALNLLNQRAFTIILFLTGIVAALLLVPQILEDGITKREAAGIILMIFLPYLIMKGVILITLLILDISINFSAKNMVVYKINFEKAKARVAKVLADKGLVFSVVDNFELGIEKYFVSVLQKYTVGTRFNYPANFLCNKPFIVIRVYDLKNGQTQVKVLYEEEKEAEIAGRIATASLQALEKEELEKMPQQQTNFIAGSIRMFDSQKPPEAEKEINLELKVPEKKIEPQKAGILEKLHVKKKKK